MSEPALGRVAELWRYPVKSLRGERLEEATCEARGFEWDRRWAVRGADGKLGSGKTTQRFRRMPGLLSMSSAVDEDARAWVQLADGSSYPVGDPVTAAHVGAVVGEPVEIAEEEVVPHFDDAPVHIVSTSSLAWLASLRPADGIDTRRFRPNIVLDGDESLLDPRWAGRSLRIGEAVLRVEKPTERCVMVTMAQADLGSSPGILRTLTEESAACFGVYCRVEEPGAIRVGDEVLVVAQ